MEKSGRPVQLKMARWFEGLYFCSTQRTCHNLSYRATPKCINTHCLVAVCLLEPKPNGSELTMCHIKGRLKDCFISRIHCIFSLACNLNRAIPISISLLLHRYLVLCIAKGARSASLHECTKITFTYPSNLFHLVTVLTGYSTIFCLIG